MAASVGLATAPVGRIAMGLLLLLGLGDVPAAAQGTAAAPAAQQAAAPATAEDLKAAIAEIRARLEQQRQQQPATTAPAQPQLSDELKAAGERLRALTQSMEELRAERDRLRSDFEGARAQLARMSDELVARERELRGSIAAQTAQTAEIGGLQANAAKLQQGLDQTRAELAAREKALGETEAARREGEQGLAELRAQLAAASRDASTQLREAQSALEARGSALGAAESKLKQAEQEIAGLRQRVGEQESTLGATAGDLETTGQKLRASEERANGLQQALDQANQRQAELLKQQETERATASAAARTGAERLTAASARGDELAQQVALLQAAAGSSVAEVRNLGEQLLAALSENQELKTSLEEVRVTRQVLDQQLQAARRDAQMASGEAAGLRDELAKARDGLISLVARDPGAEDAAGAAGTAAAARAAAQPPALVALDAPDAAQRPQVAATSQPAMLAALRELNATSTADGWLMVVPAGLDFRPGTADLVDANGGAVLDRVADLVRGMPASRIRVAGHTDSNGGADDNLRLSLGRANAVRQLLIDRLRLDPAVIEAEGFGESRPIASNESADGRRSNRRVEIYLQR